METLACLQSECREDFQPLKLVFGDGRTQEPPMMLIGEAPGEQEALQGKPFVGKAGKNLTEFLEAVGLDRGDLYISNVVKFRPTKLSAAGRMVNRPPTRKEIEQFKPWLLREIAIVKPKVLVTLGNVALGALIPKGGTIGDFHGRWQTVTIVPPGNEALKMPLFALYHPASVIYNRALSTVYQGDLLALRDSLEHYGVRMDS